MAVVTKNEKTGYWSDPEIKAKSFGGALAQGNWLIRYKYGTSERMTPAISVESALLIVKGVLEYGHEVTITPITRDWENGIYSISNNEE